MMHFISLSCAVLRSKSISQWLCQGYYFINLMVFLKDIPLAHFSSKLNLFLWFVHLGTGRTLAATGIGILQDSQTGSIFFSYTDFVTPRKVLWLSQMTSAFTEGSLQPFCGDCVIFFFLDC